MNYEGPLPLSQEVCNTYYVFLQYYIHIFSVNSLAYETRPNYYDQWLYCTTVVGAATLPVNK